MHSHRLRRVLLALIGFVAGLLSLAVGWRLARRNSYLAPVVLAPDGLVVTVVNVGFGEASWFRTPDGKFVVIGTGAERMGRKLVRSLKKAGATQIDLLVLPCTSPETLGGTPEVVAALPIREVWVSGVPEKNEAHRATNQALRKTHTPMRVVRSGQKKVVDGGELLVLAPSGDFSLKRSPENNSLVVRLAWRNQSFLWGGAMQIAEETALLDRVSELKTDWLRIPGGAGKDTNSAEFLEAISPHIAVLSIGENKQGQPYPATLQRIQATGARLLRTEPGGNNLTFTADGETIEIRP